MKKLLLLLIIPLLFACTGSDKKEKNSFVGIWTTEHYSDYSEFKDVLLSVQVMDLDGRVFTIKSKDIRFGYRESNLPKDLIFLSASFLTKKKENSQPLRVKTGGSTFKNPINQSEKKVWELIKESVDSQASFGDARISDKHNNFFINSKNASFENMLNLINFVKNRVKEKTGVSLELELEIVK